MNNKKEFCNYFDNYDDHEYDFAFKPLPSGVLSEYVSSTYLDGFINYVTIIKAFLLTRYYEWDYLNERRNPEKRTKRQQFDWIKSGKGDCHTKIYRDFDDDVLILAKAYNYDKTLFRWIVFYYDRDVSDCMIGAFETEDSDEEVISLFSKYAQTIITNHQNEAEEIPSNLLTGWISS